jgi:hypothetical protein
MFQKSYESSKRSFVNFDPDVEIIKSVFVIKKTGQETMMKDVKT